MVLTKAKKERMKQNHDLKLGKKCEVCGSEFELQLHHDKDPQLPRTDPKKDGHVIVLCATCHFQEDFWKIMATYSRARMRKYDKQCAELETYFKRISK